MTFAWINKPQPWVRRVTVWALELLSEALGTGLVMGVVGVIATFRDSVHGFGEMLGALLLVTLVSVPTVLLLFFFTGYVVSTAFCRIFWRDSGWAVASVCAVLYFLHAEFCFAFFFHPPADWPLRLVVGPLGGLVTLGCVAMGNRIERRWQAA